MTALPDAPTEDLCNSVEDPVGPYQHEEGKPEPENHKDLVIDHVESKDTEGVLVLHPTSRPIPA